jgi:hypothetical protein
MHKSTVVWCADVLQEIKKTLVHYTTGCIKKLNRFEIALNFEKQLSVSSFLYIWLLCVLIM